MGDWQRYVLASSGYLELGMLDDAALALEEIKPEDKTRTEVLGARVVLYIAAKKWDMAAAVASHLVKVEPKNEVWWINLAYSVRHESPLQLLPRVRMDLEVSTAYADPGNGLSRRSIRFGKLLPLGRRHPKESF